MISKKAIMGEIERIKGHVGGLGTEYFSSLTRQIGTLEKLTDNLQARIESLEKQLGLEYVRFPENKTHIKSKTKKQ